MSRPPVVLESIGPEVERARAAGAPIVALESTVITHGLPPGEGVATGLELESVVRKHGAVPATIGVVDGVAIVGMSEDQLRALAEPGRAVKLNLGNLAAVMAAGGTGSTTVATTLWIAARAGIRVLATGGIGGVHRGDSGDESADLITLSRVPVAVVCAGAKAILDLPRTRERLETLGIPVLGFRTSELPAFYWRSSGLPVDQRCDDEPSLARALRTHWALGGAGVVIGNPIPAEDELKRESLEPELERAQIEAREQHITGRALTPFLLERLRERTGGRSSSANRALLRHNAEVAARIASALIALG